MSAIYVSEKASLTPRAAIVSPLDPSVMPISDNLMAQPTQAIHEPTDIPAASRVLEAADLPLNLILEALPLRPLALAASTCKLWRESGQERLSLARPDERRTYAAQRSSIAASGKFGAQGNGLLVCEPIGTERAISSACRASSEGLQTSGDACSRVPSGYFAW